MKIRDNRQRGWFWVDNKIIDIVGKKIGPYGIAVYVTLTRFANNDTQSAYPSINTLARLTGMSPRKVVDVLRDLEKFSLISITKRSTDSGDPDTNEYTLLDTSEIKDDPQEPSTPNGGGACGAGGDAGGTAYGAGGVLHTVQEGGACGAYKQYSEEKDSKEQDFLYCDAPSPKADITQKHDESSVQKKESVEIVWTESQLQIKQVLESLDVLPYFNDPAYWKTLESWIDSCGYEIFFLDELKAYLAHQSSISKGGRGRHKDLKRGFRNWLSIAISIRRSHAEREAARKQYGSGYQSYKR